MQPLVEGAKLSPEESARFGPMPVFARCLLRALDGIDTAEQRWHGDVELELFSAHPRGTELGLGHAQYNLQDEPGHVIHQLLPVELLNAPELSSREEWLTPRTVSQLPSSWEEMLQRRYGALCASPGVQWFSFSMRLRGAFTGRFKLEDFPLDAQHLAVELKLQEPQHAIRFEPAGAAGGLEGFDSELRISAAHCATLAAWRVLRRAEAVPSLTDPRDSRSRLRYSQLTVKFSVQRRYKHYLLTSLLPYALVTSFALLIAAEDADAVGSRLQTASGLLTASLAFSRYGSASLPQVAYQTLLDRYCTTALIFVVAAGAEVTLVGRVLSPAILRLIGRLAGWATQEPEGVTATAAACAVAPAGGAAASDGISEIRNRVDNVLWVLWFAAWATFNGSFGWRLHQLNSQQYTARQLSGEVRDASGARADDSEGSRQESAVKYAEAAPGATAAGARSGAAAGAGSGAATVAPGDVVRPTLRRFDTSWEGPRSVAGGAVVTPSAAAAPPIRLAGSAESVTRETPALERTQPAAMLTTGVPEETVHIAPAIAVARQRRRAGSRARKQPQ